MKKCIFLFIFIFYHLSYAVENKTIQFFCPSPSSIDVKKQSGSWANYHYQAIVSLDLPEEGNQLVMMGEGMEDHINTFYSFDWTDNTVLCNYDFESQGIVIFETVLSHYVTRCYFKSPSGKEFTYCHSTDPEECPIFCDLLT